MNKCPVCGSGAKPEFIEKYGIYTINRCPACDVFFSDPMKNPGSDWYEKSEFYTFGKFFDAELAWHHNQFLKDGEIYGKRLLDVGCGTGAFLNSARQKGYDVWGLDFDRGNVLVAKERFGLEKICVKSIEELSMNVFNERFDVVTFFEVLEHLDDPVQFTSKIKDILKPGGYIALSVPNRDRRLDTLGDGDYPPNHLTRWNQACLSAFLERNGFEIIKCVSKKLNSEEFAGYLKSKIRLGVAKSYAKRGVESNQQAEIHKAAFLMKIKDSIFKWATFPLTPLLFVTSFQGTGLYALARLKK